MCLLHLAHWRQWQLRHFFPGHSPSRRDRMPHLEVKVGPDRFHMEPCRVNDMKHPHEINTDHFVGRVLVRIIDAPGAKQGEPGREYFRDRTRRFCIQIEGRFKQQWSGDDILFGSDFDKFVPFPRAPFNAGMRVARMIDPCTFYEEHPPSGRPYIMSPYTACMNVFCAWPAPSRLDDAVVVAHDNGVTPSLAIEHENDGGVVPVEHVTAPQEGRSEKKGGWLSSLRHPAKDDRVTAPYWRFIGFRNDERVRAYVAMHPPNKPAATPTTPAPVRPVPVHPVPVHPTPRAGVPQYMQGIDTKMMSTLGSSKKADMILGHHHMDRPGTPQLPVFMASNLQVNTGQEYTIGSPGLTHPVAPTAQPGKNDLMEAYARTGMTPSPALSLSQSSSLDEWLGPWRFGDPGADMVEDNAFIFTEESVSVPKRRKHFANDANRKNFTYHPDVVYGASFFSNLFDFNTFDLNIGPVHINVNPFFRDMPIRYTLRSKTNEEIVFCTISFQLVD
ncbi:hypothetical protein Malapachy_0942 [Malassezia pachydermatis]|uniref:Domain of unknown function at the cortex 1 domain-containing protein n=1 Tax=Malassezia pachydermatis TaxID=77020 RepID=A0A0M8MLH6_9BASI|nr:hypothetical protein Malapachy_0942 [Malassezia pachydermatis]KOS14896.1 hypothetical protein Malapachy_0942 [Malassezia pachydermatis]